MDHVAILSTKLPWLDRILAGQKTLESRWLRHRSLPWQRVTVGDTVYFKNSGQLISAKAIVSSVDLYDELDSFRIRQLLDQHQEALGLFPGERRLFEQQVGLARYLVLVGLRAVTVVDPFAIHKHGFGAMSAWLTVPDINSLRIGDR